MQTIHNHYKTILICSAVTGLIIFAGLSIKPAQAQIRTGSHWLSQYDGKIIQVTFNSVPPGKDKIEKVRLVLVQSTGIVVKYEGPNAIFYTFSNIIAIDPIYN
jgi:hypothetical protein